MDKREVCRELVRTGEVGRALDVLSGYYRETNSPLQNEVLLLSGQLKEYNKNKSLGLPVDATTPNRIAKAVLDLLEDHPLHQPNVRPNPSMPRYLAGGALLLLVMALIVWLISRTGGDTVTHGAQSPVQDGNNNVIEYHNKVDTNASK